MLNLRNPCKQDTEIFADVMGHWSLGVPKRGIGSFNQGYEKGAVDCFWFCDSLLFIEVRVMSATKSKIIDENGGYFSSPT